MSKKKTDPEIADSDESELSNNGQSDGNEDTVEMEIDGKKVELMIPVPSSGTIPLGTPI